MLSRNTILAVLIVAIAIGVIYMLDPTFGGLLGKREGFYAGEVIHGDAAASMSGQVPTEFPSAGSEDEKKIKENPNNATPAGATESTMAPQGAVGAGVESAEGFENYNPAPMPFAGAGKPANCYPKNQLAPQELLPNDPNSKWAEVNPSGAGDIAGKNFLNAGALVGVNTIGSSLRNASWDLRSEVPNPQVVVSPWNQTSISPDLARRPLEIA